MSIAISIKDLHKTYENGHRALNGITLEIKEGDFFALLGANGAGKSTTIGVIATLVRKSAGSVEAPSASSKCRDCGGRASHRGPV